MYSNSAFSDIHKRIGEEINKHKVRRVIKEMVVDQRLYVEGINRWARYSIEQKMRESDNVLAGRNGRQR